MFSNNYWECESYVEDRIKTYVEEADAYRRFQHSHPNHRSLFPKQLARIWGKRFSRSAIKREASHEGI